MMETPGAVISFHEVSYSVYVKSIVRKCAEEEKVIIDNVSGIFKPGMNAILGPTGSGKTTLLDILAGRKSHLGIEGNVLVDGKPQPKNFKRLSGYVVQEDLITGTLTVKENIMFSANLRLPRKMNQTEKRGKVEEVLRELGLEKCADSKVGTELMRGVSGGEKRRTNIGMELVISPSILFLDEPTTGLDANTAASVMELLYKLSLKGNTIVFSIHQPRYTIYKFFDNILLLGNGRVIYHGPALDTLNYFEQLGHKCEQHDNPADFFLDVINREPHKRTSSLNLKEYKSEGELTYLGQPTSLADLFLGSTIYISLEKELKNIYLTSQNFSIEKGMVSEYESSYFTQVRFVCGRSVKNLLRSPESMAAQMFFAAFFSVLVGFIYFQIGNKFESAFQNRSGAIFFIIMYQMFTNLTCTDLFIKEKRLFLHECASGYYRVTSYFFAKIISDFLPMRLVPVTIFSIISYFMIGFQVAVDKFFIFFLSLFLAALGGSAVAFFTSSSVHAFIFASILTIAVYVLMMLFGGFLANLKTMPYWLNWLQYLSIVRYSINMISINELHDLVLVDTINGTSIPMPNVGKKYLDGQSIAHETLWDFWQNALGLSLITVVFMALSYGQLKRALKGK